jgi:GNAT superfamily N-acetyltransferase
MRRHLGVRLGPGIPSRAASAPSGATRGTAAAAVIRRAEPPDVAGLVHLLGVLFGLEADFRPDAARQRRGLVALLAAPAGVVLVAERGGRVVGMVTGQLLVSTAEGGPAVLVEDLVVDEGARGGGLGRALLDAVEAWARGRGATRVQLLVDEENAPALGFYRRLGWQATRLRALRRRP